jgi:hypothetical protein
MENNELIIKFNNVHNNYYDYSKVKYTKAILKVTVICPLHGEFKISPNSHLNGSGCYKCGLIKTGLAKRSNTEEFIKKAKLIHGDKYSYDNVNYVTINKHVSITCTKHGDFLQKPIKHLVAKSGCKKCSNEKNYINFHEELKKVFPEYDSNNSVYKGMSNDVTVCCPKHGDFTKKAAYLLHKKRGCPKCINYSKSKKETEWLDSLNIPNNIRNMYIKVNDKTFCVDAYDENTKTIYEYYGDFFHGNPLVYDSNTFNKKLNKTFGELYDKTIKKENSLKEAGFNLITKWENDYKKIKK